MQLFAQQIQVNGNVQDEQGESIVGANVVVKGTSNGTITDLDGNFQLTVDADVMLVISFIGYQTQEWPAKPVMNITLREDTELLDEVVVIGYGQVKKNDLSGSVVAIKAEDMNKGAVTSPQELIQGKVPGLYVSADNGQNPRANREIIFPVIFDGNTTQSYGMAAVILGSRSSSDFADVPAGIGGGWDGFRGTPELVFMFDYQDNENPKADEILDKRGIFYDKHRSIDITTSVTGTFTTEGWSVYKFTNLRSDGQPGSNTTFPDTDFPMYRLADVYLMYAEAVARGGQGGNLDTSVQYINALRERAYGDTSHGVTETWLTENNYRNILDERCRELYWEGTRRTDLIRYGLFTSGDYLWTFKGGVLSGTGVSSRYNVFPIPVTDMSVNGMLKQNEGY